MAFECEDDKLFVLSEVPDAALLELEKEDKLLDLELTAACLTLQTGKKEKRIPCYELLL